MGWPFITCAILKSARFIALHIVSLEVVVFVLSVIRVSPLGITFFFALLIGCTLLLLTLLDISLAVTLTHLYTKKVRELIRANSISVQQIIKNNQKIEKKKVLSLSVTLEINQESTNQSNGNSQNSDSV